ncbi:MAG TPA: ATP-binding protein [Stellaceae bacterium]|nr:ATP-binding protein [Stellaceae bacterium]
MNQRPLDAEPTGAAPSLRAIRMLRLLLAGTILVPLLVGAIAAYVSYSENYGRAATALSAAVTVAEENTTKILDTHLLVAARIDDLIASLTDAEIHTKESSLHDQIGRQIAGLPQVAAAWVIDATGHELVSARVFPVNPELDQSDRDDFRALRDADAQTFISAVRARSLEGGDYQPYFTISRRRQGPDGEFRGVIVVAVSGNYFGSFYNSLLGAPGQYTASVLKDDGSLLASYPAPTLAAAALQPDPLLAQAIAHKTPSGVIESGSALAESGRLVAYKRVADYPVYVAISRSQAAIFHEWLGSMTGYAIVEIPAAIALIVLSVMALRRTRREQAALTRARDEVARRAAIETRLHQAQKLEAIGQLTAGMAHDFSNLLTIISGNISLAQASHDGDDPKRQRWLTAAMNGCERAASLTKRLLGFARREADDPHPVDPAEVIASTLELPWQSGEAVTIDMRLQDRPWPVFVNPDQLVNAILNLALNARDAMPDGGTLTIECSNCRLDRLAAEQADVPAGDYVGIFVSDTGSGMPPEVQEKAFDPFFTTKEAGVGTGLGLSQVYGFITRSGGHCAIESRPGRGTTVKLYLPRYTGDWVAPETDAPIADQAAS